VRKYDLAIFDLDGTLIDSQQDLVNAVNATRAWMGLEPLEAKLIASYVGDGAPVLIQRSLGAGVSERDLEQALQYFLDYYRQHCLDFTRPYPGTAEALSRLEQGGVTLAVLTNKPERISRAILEGLGMNRFLRVYGGNSFESKKPHPAGVLALLKETGVAPARALMVGDSAVDVLTARNGGIAACGVTYGFRPESFREAPPDYLIGSMSELPGIVLNGTGA
jgi:phosphoglycolate phosphatase